VRITGVLITMALLAAVALLLVGQASAAAAGAPVTPSALADPSTSLNVMVFNIEDGGTLVSFAKVAEAIKASGADVVGIEEAQGHIGRLARLLGWPYYSTRCQILSKYPLIDPPSGNGVYLFVEPQPGKVVAMMNVHLPSDPYGPYWVRDGKTATQVIALEKKVRLAALQAQLAALPSLLAHQIPVFLTGDFNSPSFLD
jgi:endonuclease/exonuclease/phosphatase (EEP) superfamily protein YafD